MSHLLGSSIKKGIFVFCIFGSPCKQTQTQSQFQTICCHYWWCILVTFKVRQVVKPLKKTSPTKIDPSPSRQKQEAQPSSEPSKHSRYHNSWSQTNSHGEKFSCDYGHLKINCWLNIKTGQTPDHNFVWYRHQTLKPKLSWYG